MVSPVIRFSIPIWSSGPNGLAVAVRTCALTAAIRSLSSAETVPGPHMR
jgi:hypothetical protein